MFPIDDVSSLISESCLLYDYQDLCNDIMDFAFHFVRVYVLNFERNVTLVISQPATVRDVFKFSKEYFGMKNHPARIPHLVFCFPGLFIIFFEECLFPVAGFTSFHEEYHSISRITMI